MKHPQHIAIILDGNRRFARKLGLEAFRGHEYGLEKVEQLLDWLLELGIRETTLWCFSTENFRRQKVEVDYLMDLFRKKFLEMTDDARIKENKVRINFVGRLDMLPEDVRNAARELSEATKAHGNYVINIALAYGGRAELVDAARAAAEESAKGNIDPKSLDEKSFEKFLYFSSEPDIIIRPGGETRTSGFLPWQSAYSEWFFLEKLWPEIEKQDLVDIIAEFRKRERRYGE